MVLVSVPGAFTGTCSEKHLPGYLANLAKFKVKGVDKIAVIAYNDAYVMSAWAKAHGVQDEDIVSIWMCPPPFSPVPEAANSETVD